MKVFESLTAFNTYTNNGANLRYGETYMIKTEDGNYEVKYRTNNIDGDITTVSSVGLTEKLNEALDKIDFYAKTFVDHAGYVSVMYEGDKDNEGIKELCESSIPFLDGIEIMCQDIIDTNPDLEDQIMCVIDESGELRDRLEIIETAAQTCYNKILGY